MRQRVRRWMKLPMALLVIEVSGQRVSHWMSPEMARSCGWRVSAFTPLSEEKQTSGEQVENDAIETHCRFDD
jgi:hypothetical protein